MSEGRKIMQVRSARQVPIRVQLLDDEILDITVDKRAVGWILFDKVCEHLNILEKDYFGLNFINPQGLKYWLDLEKKVSKQMKGLQAWNLCFEVKFYPADPLQMVEDLTRYQLCLQIRRDIVNERVPCSTVTYALLGSFTAQSELGDFEVEEFGSGTSYLKDLQFAPHQDRDLLSQIAKLHRSHKGLTPEDAELKFLENAKKLALYGVELHPAKDAEGKDIQLGVCASGILVYKDKQQVNRFVWPKILKMSYRRNKFYIKIRPGEFESFASLIGFRTTGIKMAKRLWKICVEHHSFFRFKEPEPVKSFSVIPRFGSRFRYSGRTQYQSRHIVSEEARDTPYFDRVLSKRGTFAGRTNNMRQRDDDRKRQRDEMRRQPPPDTKPLPNNGANDFHPEPKGSPPEIKRPPPEPRHTPPEPRHPPPSPPQTKKTPPEPKHAPPTAPKPKPNIAPKPKASPRGPRSVDGDSSFDRGSRGSLDSLDGNSDRRSKMEKMHAVMTPLAMVMQKSLEKKDLEESDEEDRRSYNNRMEDHSEVGMKACKAKSRSGLINTNKGCRNKDSYLFSYPSSSIDSILSNDFDEYATDHTEYQSNLEQRVASDEHLNASCASRMKSPKNKSSYACLSQSAENILSEEKISHYTEIDHVVEPDGIYAEIDDVINSSRNPNNNDKQNPGVIQGRRSLFFKPNQKQYVDGNDLQAPSHKHNTKVENDSMLKQTEKQKGKITLTRPKPLVPHYSQVNKRPKKSTASNNSQFTSQSTSACTPVMKLNQDDNLISTLKDHTYDVNDGIKGNGHKRQDSQTSQASLKDELKMYIITPEKLRQNADEISMQTLNKKGIELNTFGSENSKLNTKDKEENTCQELRFENLQNTFAKGTGLELIEKCKDITETMNEMSKDDNAPNVSENRNTSIDSDTFVVNEQSEPRHQSIKHDCHDTNTCEEKDISLSLDSTRAKSMTSLYQLTFDTCSHNSPEPLDGLPDTLNDNSYETDACHLSNPEKSDYKISQISFDSDKNSSNRDTSLDNSEKLEESLELFCSLSSDSSDFEQDPYVFKRGESKRMSSFSTKNKHPGKTCALQTQESEQSKDVKRKSVSLKPKSVMKNVTSFVKKVPGLNNARSKKNEFVCEQFESEPRRIVSTPSTGFSTLSSGEKKASKPLKDNSTPDIKNHSSSSKDVYEKDQQPEPVTSTANSSLEKDRISTLSKPDKDTKSEEISDSNQMCSKHSPLMDFFVRPKIFEDFHSNSAGNPCSKNYDKYSPDIKQESPGSEQDMVEQNIESEPQMTDGNFENKAPMKEIESSIKNCPGSEENYGNICTGDDNMCTEYPAQSIQRKVQDPFWYKTHLLPVNVENNAKSKKENRIEGRTNYFENVSTEMSVKENGYDTTNETQIDSNVIMESVNDKQQNYSHTTDGSVQSCLTNKGPEIKGNKVIYNEREAKPEMGGSGVNTNGIKRTPDIEQPTIMIKEAQSVGEERKLLTQETNTGSKMVNTTQHMDKPETKDYKVDSKEREVGPEVKRPALTTMDNENNVNVCKKEYEDEIRFKESESRINRENIKKAANKAKENIIKPIDPGPLIKKPLFQGKETVPEIKGSKVYASDFNQGPKHFNEFTEQNKESFIPNGKSGNYTKQNISQFKESHLSEIKTGQGGINHVSPRKDIDNDGNKAEKYPNMNSNSSKTGTSVERSVVYSKSIKQGPVVKEFTVQVSKTENVPLVKGSKVFTKEVEIGPEIRLDTKKDSRLGPVLQTHKLFTGKADDAVGSRRPADAVQSRPDIIAGNVKPMYKLDYSSDSSSSISSRKPFNSNTTDQRNNSFESQGNNHAQSIDTKRKVSPGVVHMVRPAPASWMEGGLEVPYSRKSREQPESKHFVSVLDSDKVPTTSKPIVTSSVLDFDCTNKTVNDENESHDDIPSIDRVESDSSSIKSNVLEPKEDAFSKSIPSGAVTELLCKRVWKFPKNKSHKKTNPDGNSGSEISDVEKETHVDHPGEIISDEIQNGCHKNGSVVVKDDHTHIEAAPCVQEDEDDPVVVLDQQESFKSCPSDNVPDERQCNVPDEMQDNTHNEEHSANLDKDRLGNEQNSIYDCGNERQTDKNDVNNSEHPDELSNEDVTKGLSSQQDFSYSDSSSEGETSTDNSDSEDEIVCFEMPKLSRFPFKEDCDDPDIPFIDENVDNTVTINDSNTTGPTALPGFAIDCSLENVTTYKVSDNNTKGQGNNLPESTNPYSNVMPVDDDRYDVNYWDEDIGFDDYDDCFSSQGCSGPVPVIIDTNPYIPKRSNLKNNLRRETTFSDRRVHFPGNLPVYKSKKKIEQENPNRRSEQSMNTSNEENSKMHHLQQFIYGLFDEEPRNRCLPRDDPIALQTTTQTKDAAENQPFSAPTTIDDTNMGFQSALTFENVNFSLSPLDYYTIYNRDRRTDVITTDLDDLDYNDDGFESSLNCSESPIRGTCDANKIDKRASAKIVKPVTRRKTKCVDQDESIDAHNYDSQSGSFVDTDLGSTGYTSQCSAEFTDHLDTNTSPIGLSDFNEDSLSQQHLRNPIPLTDTRCISPSQVGEQVKADKYVDVSELGKKATENSSTNSIKTVEACGVYVQPGNKPAEKITKYSYSYPDDSDPDSPKIKYVTYEYVTEYRLNNVKIQYQHNKKIQTDSKPLDINTFKDFDYKRGGNSEDKTDGAGRKESKCVGNESHYGDNTLNDNEVVEEAIEPFINKKFCIPLGEKDEQNESTETRSIGHECGSHESLDEREVLEEAIEPFITRSVCIPLEEDLQNNKANNTVDYVDGREVLEDIVEPFITRSACHPLGEVESSKESTEIEVEEVIEQAVCHPLGPIEGISSGHPMERGNVVVDEHIELSVCQTLGSQPVHQCESETSSGLDRNSQRNRLGDNYTDDKKEQQTKYTDRDGSECRDDIALPKHSAIKGLGIGYTEKKVVEHESEKYVFQCYQPSSYTSDRFPRYIPMCSQNKDSTLKNEQSDFFLRSSKQFKDKIEHDVAHFPIESSEKLCEDRLQIGIFETAKDMHDSGYETFTEEPLMGNETDTDDLLNESVEFDREDEIYSDIMQEHLPDLNVEESTEKMLLVVQAMAVLAISAVLVFFLPYIG